MIRHFKKNEATFDELLNQLQFKPEIDTVRRTIVFYEDGRRVTESDAEREVKKLMKRLGLEVVSARGGHDENVYMELVPNKLSVGWTGEIKGYAHIRKSSYPTKTFENLDTLENISFTNAIYLKHIKDDWYIYLETLD